MTAEEFNERYEVGQRVLYTDAGGMETRTCTTSKARHLMMCGTPVIDLRGVDSAEDGTFMLSRITPTVHAEKQVGSVWLWFDDIAIRVSSTHQVWLTQHNGEAMGVSMEDMRKLLQAYYKDNF